MTPDAAGVAAGAPPALEEITAHARDRGEVGVRNRVLVLPSVICSHVVAERIADAVEGAVSAPHDHGCAQIGDDKDQTFRTFVGVGTNPNVAGTLVVGLGCETVQSGDVATALEERDVPVEQIAIQDSGGTDECIADGVEAAGELTGGTGERVGADLSDVTVGIVATDLRESSLERADPLVGAVAGQVADAGGRVLVAGTERFSPHGETLRERVATDDAREGLETMLERVREEPARVTSVHARAAETPFGGIAQLWDDRPVRDVLSYSEPATHEQGVALVDAPSSFTEAATGLVAAGAQVILHVTADGDPVGHPLAPVYKLTGEDATYDALGGDIDAHAGRTSPADLLADLRDVLDGAPTAAETHGVTRFGITRSGPSM